jgi:hypothetical protein
MATAGYCANMSDNGDGGDCHEEEGGAAVMILSIILHLLILIMAILGNMVVNKRGGQNTAGALRVK